MKTKIIIASDHAGRKIKEKAEKSLIELKLGYEDYSLQNKKDDDYPDFAKEVGLKVVNAKAIGILVCGTGIGMSIAANKIKGIRAALVHTKKEAELARNDNDANILVLPGSYSSTKLNDKQVKEIIKTFYETKYKDLTRFKRRINKIKTLEK